MPNGRNSPRITNLRRRVAAVEQSLSLTDKTREGMILSAHSISQENLEWLIDATLAPRQGRELREREAAAQRAYAAALEVQCRCRGLTVRGIPAVSELIFQAAVRGLCESDMQLSSSGIRTLRQGFEPSASELAAIQLCKSTLEAQYQRAGFSSQAEFERWYGKEPPTRKAA